MIRAVLQPLCTAWSVVLAAPRSIGGLFAVVPLGDLGLAMQ